MADDLLHDLLTAERGSRELDARVLCASLGDDWYVKNQYEDGSGKWLCYSRTRFIDRDKRHPQCKEAAHYTTNMQDTIEAVPEGHEWSVGRAAGCGRANVWVPNPLRSVNIPTSPTKAATPQLALSAAILKAKGAQDGS